MSDQSQTISIPSILLLGVIGVIAVRYFFFTPASSTSRPTNSRTANPQDVEQIATMFPQIPRRNIIWDLQRNGGSVAATTERVLSRGTLDTPPPTFQPPIPANSTPSTANTAPNPNTSEHIDLIKRYNLEGKLSSPPPSSDDSSTSSAQHQSWSNNKNERQALLQRRREEMVLNARRKMEEKERENRI